MNRNLALSTLLALAACSDGDSSNGAPPYDTALNDLDESGLASVCRELNARMRRDTAYVQLNCTTTGILLSADAMSCEEARTECLEDKMPFCDEAEFQKQEKLGPECDSLTVRTYLDCLDTIRAESVDTYAGISCETSDAELTELTQSQTDNAEELVKMLCPDLFDACPTFAEE